MKNHDEQIVPLSPQELEERSDEALFEPRWAPRVDYGRYLIWKEHQAAQFRANPSQEAAETCKANAEALRVKYPNGLPEPWNGDEIAWEWEE